MAGRIAASSRDYGVERDPAQTPAEFSAEQAERLKRWSEPPSVG